VSDPDLRTRRRPGTSLQQKAVGYLAAVALSVYGVVRTVHLAPKLSSGALIAVAAVDVLVVVLVGCARLVSKRLRHLPAKTRAFLIIALISPFAVVVASAVPTRDAPPFGPPEMQVMGDVGLVGLCVCALCLVVWRLLRPPASPEGSPLERKIGLGG